jgi:hypothetical protein
MNLSQSWKIIQKSKVSILPLAVTIVVVFMIATLPYSYKLVGNSGAAIGLPTEVQEITDGEDRYQNIPILLQFIHGVVVAMLVIAVAAAWK